MITQDACWADYRVSAEETCGRPCLFLDRDGVLIEDTGYPHRADEIVVVRETLALVRDAQQQGFAVGIVTNQSGIGRGLFGWPAFSSVQAVIDEHLRQVAARIDFVLACPYHAEAIGPLYRRTHAWRKPEPGMILAAAGKLALDLSGSAMVGDRHSDMRAAKAADIPHRLLLTGSEPVVRDDALYVAVSRAGLGDAFTRISAR